MTNLFCPDCTVKIGEKHKLGCDVTRCKVTGEQLLSCGFDPDCYDEDDLDFYADLIHECEPCVWTGLWPGVKVCQDNGWYTDSNSIFKGTEDLNSVPFRATWNSELEDWEANK